MKAAEIIAEVSAPNVIPATNSKEFIDSSNFMYGLMRAVAPISGDAEGYANAIISAVIKRSSGNLKDEFVQKIIADAKRANPDFLNPDKDAAQLQNDLKSLSPKITQVWYQGRKNNVLGNVNDDASSVVDANLEKLVGIHPRRGREFLVVLYKLLNDPTRREEFTKKLQNILNS